MDLITACETKIKSKSLPQIKAFLDENNIPYNYWSDGTIRNIAESDTNAGNASFLYRDYNYEKGLYNDALEEIDIVKTELSN